MSLTNPKNVVTEERLSEFYGEILPYLGGMPEALANKFAKGDLYSTDEKIVGCWTNGKPLYQKTFIDTSSFSIGTTYVYKDIGDLTGLNVEDIVSINGTGGYSSDAGRYPLPLSFTDSKTVCIDCFILNGTSVRIRGKRSEGTAVYANFIVTIQYTKTTDAANSFKYANETDYSTDEKIVGTWIDGKPIYQKTIDFGYSLTNASTQQEWLEPIGASVDRVIACWGNMHGRDNKWGSALPWNIDGSVYVVVGANTNNEPDANKKNTVGIYWKGDCEWIIDPIITIQYTKTTD